MYKSGRVTLSKNLKAIPECVFTKCVSLTSIDLPDSIITIGEQAFAYCTKLQSVKIPDKVATMDWGVFWECSGLTSVTLPEDWQVLEMVSLRIAKILQKLCCRKVCQVWGQTFLRMQKTYESKYS